MNLIRQWTVWNGGGGPVTVATSGCKTIAIGMTVGPDETRHVQLNPDEAYNLITALREALETLDG